MSDSVDWNKPGGVTVPDLEVPDMHLRTHRRWPALRRPADRDAEPEQPELPFGPRPAMSLSDIARRVRNRGYVPQSHVAREEAREDLRDTDTGPGLPF